MIVIEGVLDAAALEAAAHALPQLRWEDGGKTAGNIAKAVKHNQQADLSSRAGAGLRTALLGAIQGNGVVEAYARPLKFGPCLLSRTGIGGEYGLHIDNPVMGAGPSRMRADLSFTLFLSPPETYAGGELQIETAAGTEVLKLPAGNLVIYPSTELHRVTPVTGGERVVFAGWIESAVRDGAQRGILFELVNLRASLAQRGASGADILALTKIEANLTRMWTD